MKKWKKKNQAGDATVSPTIHTYTLVMRTCALAGLKNDDANNQQAYDIAVNTLKKIQFPNNAVYGTFLQACNNLLSADQRSGIIVQIFRECCEEGQLDKFIIHMLKKGAPMEYEDMKKRYGVGADGKITVSNLPPEFS